LTGLRELAEKRARLGLARRTYASDGERDMNLLLYATVFAEQVLDTLMEGTARDRVLWRYYTVTFDRYYAAVRG